MTRRRRTPRERMRRWTLHLDARTARTLAQRAAAHGVNRAVYVRALINNERPGSVAGTEAALADAWWDSRSPSRRAAIWRNHHRAVEADDSPTDQTTIFDHLEQETP